MAPGCWIGCRRVLDPWSQAVLDLLPQGWVPEFLEFWDHDAPVRYVTIVFCRYRISLIAQTLCPKHLLGSNSAPRAYSTERSSDV